MCVLSKFINAESAIIVNTKIYYYIIEALFVKNAD